MDSISYLYIYNALMESKGGDVLEVQRTELRNLFKMLRHLMRERGWLGYEDTGELKVNRVGLVDIVKDLFRSDFEHLGTPTHIDILMDYTSNIKVVGHYSNGVQFSQFYNIPRIEERCKIHYIAE